MGAVDAQQQSLPVPHRARVPGKTIIAPSTLKKDHVTAHEVCAFPALMPIGSLRLPDMHAHS